jgi:hypothetical protein
MAMKPASKRRLALGEMPDDSADGEDEIALVVMAGIFSEPAN